ncbi:MAG: hypothetical protein HYX73_02040 [Acidobacteria bacterium]|nr:hypothetical protein [Acidobacteriota bacterium]
MDDRPFSTWYSTARALKVLRNGRPYLLDVRTETFGIGGELTWYQKYAIAGTHERRCNFSSGTCLVATLALADRLCFGDIQRQHSR